MIGLVINTIPTRREVDVFDDSVGICDKEKKKGKFHIGFGFGFWIMVIGFVSKCFYIISYPNPRKSETKTSEDKRKTRTRIWQRWKISI